MGALRSSINAPLMSELSGEGRSELSDVLRSMKADNDTSEHMVNWQSKQELAYGVGIGSPKRFKITCTLSEDEPLSKLERNDHSSGDGMTADTEVDRLMRW